MSSRGQKGVTLVELLVAVAIASILILGVIAAFQTTQRSAAIGEAREQIYQNARVALDIMAGEIKNAYIDNRNRDFIFISADGLAGRGSSILEYYENPPGTYNITYRGLGNAQTPHGVDPTGIEVFRLYADSGFGAPIYTTLSIKAISDIYTLSPGPPDRLDFTCFTRLFPGNTSNQSRLAEVRYIVTTETFIDDVDNDYDSLVDASDYTPPGAGGLTGLGDLIPMGHKDDFNPVTRKIKGLSLFQLSRGLDITPDKNPFSVNNRQTANELPTGTTQGRYPARDFNDFLSSNDGESIGSYIYDLQLEFYGKIAIALKSDGSPEVWGVGWGYQDVRGEDMGTDCEGELSDSNDLGPLAIKSGKVQVTKGSDQVAPDTIDVPVWPATLTKLVGGTFMVWPSSPPTGYTFDTADPNNDVYAITDIVSGNLQLNRPYTGTSGTVNYRIIEPTQANGILDNTGTVSNPVFPEDLGADGIVNDPLDDGGSDIPNNVSDNDGTTSETSIGEGNKRLDSRVMGIWDSRSPDPRNPRRASELNGWDDDYDYGDGSAGSGIAYNSTDDDQDGQNDDRLNTHYDGTGTLITLSDGQLIDYATPESDNTGTVVDETNDLLDDDSDNMVDDRFYEPAGKPEGIDEPDEADPDDDTLPKAVRITIAVQDPQQTLEPVILSTTVWLSTAR